MGVSKREKQFYKEQLKTLELALEDRMTAKLGNIINVYNKTCLLYTSHKAPIKRLRYNPKFRR